MEYLFILIGMILVVTSPSPPQPRPRRFSCTGFERNQLTGELDPIDKIYFDEE